MPEELRANSAEQNQAIIAKKGEERARIQAEIQELSKQRGKYLAEKSGAKPQSGDGQSENESSLDQAVIDAIHEQAGELQFTFETEADGN